MDDPNYRKAIKYFEKAAEQNHTKAMLELGSIYEEGKYRVQTNLEKALQYYERAAAQLNDEEALYYMGRLYEKGRHVPQDFGKAIKYFELSAQQHHYKALYKLGIIYRDGNFGSVVSQNLNKAIYYFELYHYPFVNDPMIKELRVARFFQEFHRRALQTDENGRKTFCDTTIVCAMDSLLR
ncbi:hypothetical protein FDP41_010979 [Naegleria fowleri]|uniref:Uncharacterized protein n=1 Tax=Naegleria fowleri TaxID=5763 RepID=A0A6A5C7A4_NAEFO|nr:uncharacterized protein FDP41_010979 [Naegleria fowleri]KAF0983001.1 hypothetical protein FDP41_010979 [Naegleria fowleri]